MGVFTIVAICMAILLIGLILWRVLTPPSRTTDAIDILVGSISGKEKKTIPGNTFKRSFNQREGATFTYTGWILVTSLPTPDITTVLWRRTNGSMRWITRARCGCTSL
jgi:hypothetical protein